MSSKGKTVLIIFATLMLVIIIGIAIFCRRKKRLSNQPAYYNDIAINDPLRYELNSADEMEDGDELPLF